MNQKKSFTPINFQISKTNVYLIDKDNNNIGITPIGDAVRMADADGLTLIQVSPGGRDKPPTAKILDYGKFKFDQSKAKKENDKRQRETNIKIKEVQFKPSTEDYDLKIKAQKAIETIVSGNRCRAVLTFKGRELSHKEIGVETFNRFISFIDVSHEIISPPKLDGKSIIAIFGPNKK